jgi:hypothetical protein
VFSCPRAARLRRYRFLEAMGVMRGMRLQTYTFRLAPESPESGH